MWDDERSVARFFSNAPGPKRKPAGIAEAFGPPRTNKELGIEEFFNHERPKRRGIPRFVEGLTEAACKCTSPVCSHEPGGCSNSGSQKGPVTGDTFCDDCFSKLTKNENYLDPHDPRPLVSVPEKMGTCKVCGFEGLVRSMPGGKGTLCVDCEAKAKDKMFKTFAGAMNMTTEEKSADGSEFPELKGHAPGCDAFVNGDASVCSCGKKDEEECTEDTTSGDIAIVPMGFKDICPNCKGEGCSSCGGSGRTRKSGPTPIEGNLNSESVNRRRRYEAAYSPKTGEPCNCTPGVWRDNCPRCEGSGMKIDFQKIHQRYDQQKKDKEKTPPVEAVNRLVRNLLGEAEEKCPKCGASDFIGGVCFNCGEGEEGAEPGETELNANDFKAAFRDRSNREAIRRRRARVTEGECQTCHGAGGDDKKCPECGAVADWPGEEDDAVDVRQLGPGWPGESVRRRKPRGVTEDIDQSVFTRLLHYKTDIPALIDTIEGIVSTNTPADSDDLYDELAEVVTLLSKADHLLATLVTSKNLRTPKSPPDDDEGGEPSRKPRYDPEKKLEVRPNAGYPMDRPDETA